MAFPVHRPRRLRGSENIRRMVRETRLSVDQLIQPFFVIYGGDVANPVGSMPGVYQFSVDRLVPQVKETWELGIPAVLLFGIPEHKDPVGSEAYDREGIIQRAIRAIKDEVPEILVITDVCLCEYTDHGHCGVVSETGEVLNDPTLELLAKEALSHVEAGADIVAPSDMMDGRVGAIRKALDEAGYTHIPILSYAVKYASAFYGPFRDAAESAPQFGDRRAYQMDPCNVREAVKEAQLDLEEGADMLMVKPALAYLDVIRVIRDTFPQVPLVAYNVSGEYSLIKAAAQLGWVDEERVMMETLLAIKRAGADIIITYFAREVARILGC
ncbi:MAG: porphobilinogen synthase [Aquificota bacterium]|nr:MAG: porphobilinogen synthase [Aquificota bacterium]